MDTSFLTDWFGDVNSYASFVSAGTMDNGLDERSHAGDDGFALQRAKKVLGTDNIIQLGTWSRSDRNAALRLLKNEGLSIRQIARFTGIGRGIIQRA